MFINPAYAIEQGWVRGIRDPNIQVQPNAIDFTMDKVFSINHENVFTITESNGKVMRGGYPLPPVESRSLESVDVKSIPSNLIDQAKQTSISYWRFQGGQVYDCLSDVYVSLPEGVSCLLVPRSTFVRNGIFITSGLYDTGFEGHIGCTVHNRSGDAQIEVGTRFGQIIFIESQNASVYAGGYNHEQGTLAHQNENS